MSLLLLFHTNGEIIVTPVEQIELEWIIPGMMVHYSLPQSRLHYTIPFEPSDFVV